MLLKLVKLYLLFILVCPPFAIEAKQGRFAPVEGSPFATGSSPASVAFSPVVSGNVFAAVTNKGNNTVSVYTVNLDSGAFTLVSAFPTGRDPVSVAFSPEVSGNLFAAVANESSGSVSSYAVDTDSGIFTLVSEFVIGGRPVSVAFSPEVSGNLFAGVADNGGGSIFMYKVDVDSGSFTLAATLREKRASSIAFSPEVSGNLFVASTNLINEVISLYKVDTDSGSLTFANSDKTIQDGLTSVAFSSKVVKDKIAVAVASAVEDEVTAFRMNTTTARLTPNAGEPHFVHNRPRSIAFSPDISGDEFAAITATSTNKMEVYKVDIAQVGPSLFKLYQVVPTGDRPYSVAFSPEVSGKVFAAVANFGDKTVSVYKVD